MFEHLMQSLGYPVVILGSFLEGEVSILIACYLATRGFMELKGVVLCAFWGTFASDQLWYLLGKHHGHRVLAWGRHWRTAEKKAQALLAIHPDLWVLCFRFFWGMRTVMPVVIGMSKYSWARYLVLDALAAIVWAVALAWLGSELGYALDALLTDLKLYQFGLLGLLVIFVLIYWLYKRRHRD